jgi:predicted ATPase/DNA-binding SARP family transcriptional activator
LAALVGARGDVVSSGRLIDELWPEAPPTTAGNTLQAHVSALRRQIGDHALVTDHVGYRLASDTVVDAERFLDLAGTTPADALDLWRGEAFDGVALGPIGQAFATLLQEQRLALRVAVARDELAGGRHETLLPRLSGWVVEQPTSQELTQSLMLALHRSGRTDDALAAFESYAGRLTDELGVESAGDLAALAEAIRRRDPTLDAPTPGLPSLVTRFIGRRAELDEAERRLHTTRLLTLTGPGGAGKTRISLQLAREVAGEYDEVRFVELGPVRPSGGRAGLDVVATAVATALEISESAHTAPLTTLAGGIGDRRLLLVLDNCEHVAELAAEMSWSLLVACPALRVLATSRVPLALPGETVLGVTGMTMPDAYRLLVERAGAGPQTDSSTALTDLCRRFDGLPLALELIAPRLRAISARDLLARLDGALDLDSERSPEQRGGLRAALDWSHALLTGPERALLHRLATFAGSFDLAAAEAVGADPDGEEPHESTAVLAVLARLVDQSLVQRVVSGRDSSWMRLLETTREYALEHLASDPVEESRALSRHGDHFAAIATQRPVLSGSGHAAWLRERHEAHDEIRVMLDRALAAGRPEQRLAAVAEMWWFWWASGQQAEGLGWLEDYLRETAGSVSVERAQALRGAASLARGLARYDEALDHGAESLAQFRALGDERGVIGALNGLVMTAVYSGRFEEAVTQGEECLAMARARGDRQLESALLNNTATALRNLGRLDEASGRLEVALQIGRETDNERGQAAALQQLGMVAILRDELTEGRAWVTEALRHYRALELAEGELDTLELLAWVDVLEGEPSRALTALLVCRRTREESEVPLLVPDEREARDRAERLAREMLPAAETEAVEARAQALRLTDL